MIHFGRMIGELTAKFEPDMLAFSGCYYGGGDKERYELSEDVYQIGTLMELVRVLALSFSDDGKRVKVSIQGSMGEGALAGMPLQLAGTRNIFE
uniref:Uncharacterized protein n=1 Tax=Lactuca sativa TaxID=4236 RepID=A0A9R1WAB8_LACSA|nr:hypothetical protein LSAT_V11C300135450 [Lactuca sativa]